MANKTVNGNTLDVPEFKGEKLSVKIGTILRLAFLVAAYLNQACDVIGAYDAFIPEKYQTLVSVVSLIATAVASVAAYWFNNSWSAEATVVDKLLATIKHASAYCPEIVDAVNVSITEFTKKEVEAAKSISIPTSADILCETPVATDEKPDAKPVEKKPVAKKTTTTATTTKNTTK